MLECGNKEIPEETPGVTMGYTPCPCNCSDVPEETMVPVKFIMSTV